MKHFKNITISIFTASLTILFVYGSYSTFASDSDEKDFENADYFWTAKYQYHNAMSDYFNVKFKAIYDAIEAEPNFFSANAKGRKYLTPPSETDINSVHKPNPSNFVKKSNVHHR